MERSLILPQGCVPSTTQQRCRREKVRSALMLSNTVALHCGMLHCIALVCVRFVRRLEISVRLSVR